MPVQEIYNFLAVDDHLATAGQPTELQLAELPACGYVCVINLGLLDPRSCLPDEAGLVASVGLAYRHIPVQFDAPTLEDFSAFLQAMDDWASKRVLVHCAANFRVSVFVALYGELRLGWNRGQADAHACRLWEPNPIWRKLLTDCRAAFLE